MKIAGVEVALCNYINFLYEHFNNIEIHLFLLKKEGDLLNRLNSKCVIHEIQISENDSKLIFMGGFKKTLFYYLKHLKLLSAAKIIIRRIVFKRLDWDLVNIENAKIEDKTFFDCAVCYMAHMPYLLKLVAERANSKYKILFIHNDFKTAHYNLRLLSKYVEKYQKYCCVSQDILNQFVKMFPERKKESIILHNTIPYEKYFLMSEEFEPNIKDNVRFKILTVGTINFRKGYDIAVKAAKKLTKKTKDFVWVFVGDGPLKEKLTKKIKQHRLDNNVIFFGHTNNPYPFFKWCNTYVQPSRSEGYCTAVLEAKLFQKRIITSNTTGMDELLNDYGAGMIIDKKLPQKYAEAILNINENGLCYNFKPKQYVDEILQNSIDLFSIFR